MDFSSQLLKEKAVSLGFNRVGLIPARPSPTLAAYQRWISSGMHAGMGYMARPDRVQRREDLNVILPGMQSMIVVALEFGSELVPAHLLADPGRGRIAAYAWGMDYHDVMTPRLELLAGWIASESRGAVDHRVYVDTGAVLERSHAQQAGLGFVGKNTMLIHPRRGSRFFLGEILTTLSFDVYDEAHQASMCGTCTRCLTACPTDALPAPYVLDARRCISYHTIENKGWIDRDLRAGFGNWVYGCDICQDVCPFQRFSQPSHEPLLHPPDPEHAAPSLIDLLLLDDAAFTARYKNTPIHRIRRQRLVRNACIAAGNWGAGAAIPHLIQLLYDASPLVRGHAAWALWRIMGLDAVRLLTACYDREDDPEVRAEIEALLA